MKKLIIFTLLPIVIFGCQNSHQTEKFEAEIEELKKRNDSLKNIVFQIKDKYVFDSLTIRKIPHYGNTNKLNSIHKEEFVFAGYNSNGKTSVIIGDTLILKNGGFHHEIKLTQERNAYSGIFKTEHDYGKSFEIHLGSRIEVEKN
ncbi:hypothetical protein QSV08_12420 [Maribacter sp. BPC-D8]|uniref:hypothetical protein n=1 Tax=Maribacter sp. BPC-D8 TaxID=3053613 RepID=UPI002B462BEB|nr:hypothetical protein [Maribacter sp. BPC-D8]WRI28029.1 hypothetical protein QSV08_12420 [Maribacter sp. BPC-D8]